MTGNMYNIGNQSRTLISDPSLHHPITHKKAPTRTLRAAGRGQVAIEYIMLLGVLLGFVMYVFVSLSSTAEQTTRLDHAKDITKRVTSTANEVFAQGPRSIGAVELEMPVTVFDTLVANRTVLLHIRVPKGRGLWAETDVFSVSAASLVGYLPIDPYTYTVPTDTGSLNWTYPLSKKYFVPVEALRTGYVQVGDVFYLYPESFSRIIPPDWSAVVNMTMVNIYKDTLNDIVNGISGNAFVYEWTDISPYPTYLASTANARFNLTIHVTDPLQAAGEYFAELRTTSDNGEKRPHINITVPKVPHHVEGTFYKDPGYTEEAFRYGYHTWNDVIYWDFRFYDQTHLPMDVIDIDIRVLVEDIEFFTFNNLRTVDYSPPLIDYEKGYLRGNLTLPVYLPEGDGVFEVTATNAYGTFTDTTPFRLVIPASAELDIAHHQVLCAVDDSGRDTTFMISAANPIVTMLDMSNIDGRLNSSVDVAFTSTFNEDVFLIDNLDGTWENFTATTRTGRVGFQLTNTGYWAPHWGMTKDYPEGEEFVKGVFYSGDTPEVDQPCYLNITALDAGGVGSEPYEIDYYSNEPFTIRVQAFDCNRDVIDANTASLDATILTTISAWYDHGSMSIKTILDDTVIAADAAGYFEQTYNIHDLMGTGNNPDGLTTLLIIIEVDGTGNTNEVRSGVELLIRPCRCQASVSCPSDAAICPTDSCYDPTCTNGCGQTPSPYGTSDEGCNTTKRCDGLGNCKFTNGQSCGSDSDCASDLCCVDTCLEKGRACCTNGVCEMNETSSSCSIDCDESCGNSLCEAGEVCPSDASTCSHGACYIPTCTNGCGQVAAAYGVQTTTCSDYRACDGEGRCVSRAGLSLDIAPESFGMTLYPDRATPDLTTPENEAATICLDTTYLTGQLLATSVSGMVCSGANGANVDLEDMGDDMWCADNTMTKTGLTSCNIPASEYQGLDWPAAATADFAITTPISRHVFFTGNMLGDHIPCYLDVSLIEAGGVYSDPYSMDFSTNEPFTIRVAPLNCMMLPVEPAIHNYKARIRADSTFWYDWIDTALNSPTLDVDIPLATTEYFEATLDLHDVMDRDPDERTTIAMAVEVYGADTCIHPTCPVGCPYCYRGSMPAEPARAMVEVRATSVLEPIACNDYVSCWDCVNDDYNVGTCLWSDKEAQCGTGVCAAGSEGCLAEGEETFCIKAFASSISLYRQAAALTANYTKAVDFEIPQRNPALLVLDSSQMHGEVQLSNKTRTTMRGTLNGTVSLASYGDRTWRGATSTGMTEGLVSHLVQSRYRASFWGATGYFDRFHSHIATGNFYVGDMLNATQPCYINVTMLNAGAGNDNPYVLDYQTDEAFSVNVTAFNCDREQINATAAGLRARIRRGTTVWFDNNIGMLRTLRTDLDLPSAVDGTFQGTYSVRDIVRPMPGQVTTLIIAVEVLGQWPAWSLNQRPVRNFAELTITPETPVTACTGYTTCQDCTADTHSVGICTWNAATGSCGASSCDPGTQLCLGESEELSCIGNVPALQLNITEGNIFAASTDTSGIDTFTFNAGTTFNFIGDWTSVGEEAFSDGAMFLDEPGTGDGTYVLTDNDDGTHSVQGVTPANLGIARTYLRGKLDSPYWPTTREFLAGTDLAIGGFFIGTVSDPDEPCYIDVEVLDANGTNDDPYTLDYATDEPFILQVQAFNCLGDPITLSGSGLSGKIEGTRSVWYDYASEAFDTVGGDTALTLDATANHFYKKIPVSNIISTDPGKRTTLVLSVEVYPSGSDGAANAVLFLVEPDSTEDLSAGIEPEPPPTPTAFYGVVSGDASGDVVFHRNYDANGTTWNHTVVESTGVVIYAVATGDLSGDGVADIVAGSASASIHRYLNNNWTTWNASSTATTSNVRAIALGDMDGDDDIDIVFAEDGGLVTMHRNDGTNGTVWSTVTVKYLSGVVFRTIAVGDMDGDGDLDVVTGDESGEVYVHHNVDGTGSTWSTTTVYTTSKDFYALDVGDIDGDGDLDIVSGCQDKRVRFHANADRIGTTWTTSIIYVSGGITWSLDVSDVDDDGYLDVVIGDSANVVKYIRNLGEGSSWVITAVYVATDDPWSVAVADADADGDGDILSAGLDYQVSLIKNDDGFWYDYGIWTGASEIYSVAPI